MQASGRERLHMGLFSIMILVYAWWVSIIL